MMKFSALAALLVAAAPAASAAIPTFPVGALSYTVNVDKSTSDQHERVFYTTGLQGAAVLPKPLVDVLGTLPMFGTANIIADKSGRVLWRYTPPAGMGVSNFRTQVYRGRKVLTWWQGQAAAGHGYGEDVIADLHGRIIKTLTPGDGLASDVHEFRITPDGRALITSHPQVGSGEVDGVASVVDIATGKPLLHWSARAHICACDTQEPGNDPYHINSIALDPKGNLVMSMRNTSTIYDVDPHTGAINWTLGGRHSSFVPGPGVDFAFQHDAQFIDAHTLRLFNDNSDLPTRARGVSSVEWIHLDLTAHRARLVRNQTHPDGLTAFAMGSAEDTPSGNTVVGWGMAPRISEFSATGELLYDATLPTGTYRAYLDNWP